jgi:hypothetical protein
MQTVGKNQNPADKVKRVSEVDEETVEVEAKAEDVECQTIEEAVETAVVEEILKAEEVVEITNADVGEDAVIPREVMIVQEEMVKHHLLWLKQPVTIAKKKVTCLVDVQTQGKKEAEVVAVAVAILKVIEVKVDLRVKFQILWQILHVIIVKKKAICLENALTQGKKENFQIVEEVVVEVVAVTILKMIEVKVDLKVKFQILWQTLHVIIVKKKVICQESVLTQEKKENFQNVEEAAVEAVVTQKMVEDGLMKIEEVAVILKVIEVVVAVEEEVEIKTEMLKTESLQDQKLNKLLSTQMMKNRFLK